MRVLQLIDNLSPGGAERMAVNLANALSDMIDRSYLVTTRAEGELRRQLDSKVSYTFLKKRISIDFLALLSLKKMVKEEEIDCIHAHGSSFFFGTLLKLIYPSIQIIWHNHSGASPDWKGLRLKSITWASKYFKAIINVNEQQLDWTFQKLKTKLTVYIPNFVMEGSKGVAQLAGHDGYRVVSLANLRNPKEHHFLVEVFRKVQEKIPQATLHLVGADYGDAYSTTLKTRIRGNGLENNIFIHGLQDHVDQFLNACDIGVLSSSSEGLPMALLEYGLAGLAVIVTAVGQCPDVVQDFGKIVPYGNQDAYAAAMVEYLEDKKEREIRATAYGQHINDTYGVNQVLHKVIDLYKTS